MPYPPSPPLLNEEGEVFELEEPVFNDVLWTIAFVAIVFAAGKVVARLGMPPLVGEIISGVIFGPPLWNKVPQPTALMLYGEVGLMLLVLEAGLDVDIPMLRLIGLRGVGVAISGSIAPLAIASSLGILVLGLDWKAALAVGCTLAPTSMGIALNVLKKGRVLNTPTGQLIIAAAVLDDVIALVLLAMLTALDDPTPFNLLLPFLVSFGLMIGVGFLGIRVVPHLMQRLMPLVKEKHREKVLLGMILGLAIGLVPVCHTLGSSHLLGAFLAGLSFCTDHAVHAAWSRQVKRVLQWLLKVFFAASIAFEIPVKSFASLEVLKGAAVLLIAILGKIATGLWALPLKSSEFFKVGFAMAAWGEFAFITATTARQQDIIDQTTFSAAILAVVVSVIVSPVLLRITIKRSNRTAMSLIQEQEAAEGRTDEVPVCYHLRTESHLAWGLNAKLMELLRTEKVDILDFRSSQDSSSNFVVNELYLRDTTTTAPPIDVEFAAVTRRIGQLLAVLSPLFTDGGTVQLDRWLPGQDDDGDEDQNGAGGGEGAKGSSSKKSDDGGGGSSPGGGGGSGEEANTNTVRRRTTSSTRTAEYDGASAPAAATRGDGRDDDELTLAGGYKAQRPTSLAGFIQQPGSSVEITAPTLRKNTDFDLNKKSLLRVGVPMIDTSAIELSPLGEATVKVTD